MNEGDAIEVINMDRLKEYGYSQYHGRAGKITKAYGLHNGKPWWYFRLPDMGYDLCLPETCLQLRYPSTTNTITINQKENNNMYVYTVRMLQVPNTLAQQAGEKEKIVVSATDVVAENEYSAIAIVAADNADAVKAVQESKGSLRCTAKSNS